MGQRSSTQRVQRSPGSNDLPHPPHLDRSSVLTSQSSPATSPQPHNRSARSLATFSRHVSAASIPVMRERPGEQGAAVGQRDAIFYEQQEERPLVHMEELGMRDAPITHIMASPMPRRSRLSRLSSMINSRDASHETTRVQPDGSAHQPRSIHRDSLEIARESQRRRSHRSSLFGAVPSGTAPGLRGNRQNALATISRPFSLRGNPTNSSSFLTVSSRTNVLHRQNSHASYGDAQESVGVGDSSISRFARFRRFISLSLDARPAILTATTHDHNPPTLPHRPTRRVLRDRDLEALPRMGTTAPTTNLNIISGSNHSHIQEMHRAGPQRTLTTIDGGSTRTRGSSWTERWSDPSIMGRRESRRVPSSLGSRSTRFMRRDPDGHLPRILSLAAFAIAAQLTGSTEQHSGDLQAIGPDALDGNLHNLYQALQDNLYRAAGDSATAEDDNGTDRSAGPTNPLNYLRVFRFVSDATNNEGQQEPSSREILGESNRTTEQGATTEARREEAGGRTITLVVVGVRSVPREEASRDTRPTSEPNLDPLSDFPQLVPASEYLSDESEGLLRDTSGRARLASHRRASSGSIGNFPANYDSQRHQRTAATTHSSYVDTLRASGSATPTGLPSTALSDSPAGPHPPPSTPAEPVLSAYSSQGTTPSRRPSSASAVQQSHLPLREAVTSQDRGSAVLSTEGQEQPQRRVQQRRRSDTEFARHRDLGAGASRRNGVVAPDDGDTSVPAASGSRSWLIYVVGTNLAQDHPALTAPSLFTDNPSYEDMLLLSSLIGPARPPVASLDDVAAAGGLLRVRGDAKHLEAEGTQGDDAMHVGVGEHCLVCLEEYQLSEELRQLRHCSHTFHRKCIDEWLTSGRNSCPLCRGEGVPHKRDSQESQIGA